MLIFSGIHTIKGTNSKKHSDFNPESFRLLVRGFPKKKSYFNTDSSRMKTRNFPTGSQKRSDFNADSFRMKAEEVRKIPISILNYSVWRQETFWQKDKSILISMLNCSNFESKPNPIIKTKRISTWEQTFLIKINTFIKTIIIKEQSMTA